jgi:hypothetical protein
MDSFSRSAVAVGTYLFISPLLSLLNPLKLVLNLFLKLQKHSFYLRDLISTSASVALDASLIHILCASSRRNWACCPSGRFAP